MCSCWQKNPDKSKIETSNRLFHPVCLEFFNLVFIPRAKLCILFCNQLAFNLFGTLSLLPSVHRWVIAAALHPAKRGVSQLRGHNLDSYRAAIFTCGLEGGHVRGSRDQSAEPCHDTPPQSWCCKPQEITDGQIQDIKHAMRQVGVSPAHVRRANENEMICLEAEHYLGFQTPPVFWATEKRCCYLMLRLKHETRNLKNPTKTK